MDGRGVSEVAMIARMSTPTPTLVLSWSSWVIILGSTYNSLLGSGLSGLSGLSGHEQGFDEAVSRLVAIPGICPRILGDPRRSTALRSS